MKTIYFIIAVFAISPLTHGEVLNIYFGTSGNEAKGIYHATLNTDNGKLDKADLAAEIDAPGFLALGPDHKKLYAVGRLNREDVVVGYRIDDSGTLTKFTESLIGDGGAAHIAVHPSGKFLLTAQYGGGSTALFSLDPSGKLGKSVITEHQGGSKVVPDRQNEPHPHWCGFSPDGQYAFVPDLGMDGVVIYKVDVNEPAIIRHGFAASIPGGGPRHMRFSVDGAFIYLLNELSSSVTTFRYQSETGTATQLTTTPSLSEEVKANEVVNAAAEILVHPNGRFVYSSNRGHDSVTAYLADPGTGQLEVIEVEPVRGAWPRNINMDPTGQWLLAAGADSNTISVFKIDQTTGKLTYQPKSIINVPEPICILIVN